MGSLVDRLTITENDNLEEFSLIWLDANAKTSTNDETQQLINISLGPFVPFDNADELLTYISKSASLDRIVLIVSGSMGKEIVPKIQHYQQLVSVYVFCHRKESHEQWAAKYSKVKAVSTTIKEIIIKIQFDHESRTIESLPISIFDSQYNRERLTKTLEGKSINLQMVIDSLLHMDAKENSKSKLVHMIKEIYVKDQVQSRNIKEFDECYSPNNAVGWYMKDTLIYQLLNKALRTQNVDVLFLFHFFVIDIKKQIEHQAYDKPVKVYRGQLMKNKEIITLRKSVGQFISINSFLMAIFDAKSAMGCIDADKDYERVLLKIEAYPQSKGEKPYAHVRSFKNAPVTDGILFMIGSIFRIISSRRQNDDIEVIQLKLCANNSKQLSSLDDENTHFSFGNVLLTMGDLDQAEIYYQHLRKNFEETNHSDLAPCYEALGIIADEKGDYASSIVMHEKALRINKSATRKHPINIASNCNYLGEAYRKQQDYASALELQRQSLEVLKDDSTEQAQSKIASAFNNMGITMQQQGKYKEALEYYMKALGLRQKYIEKDKISLGTSYNNIGNAHVLLSDYRQALECYNEAIRMYSQVLPVKHPRLASTYNNLGTVYEYMGKRDQALSYYSRALDIYRIVPYKNDSLIEQLEKKVDIVSSRMKR